MTATTIKVDSELRDRLRAAAARHGRTLGGQIEAMLVEEERRQRFMRLAGQLKASPPDDAYQAEAADWQSDRWS